MANISVLILTRNEEANLPRCLDAVAWSDDIVILDNGSTDRTVEIAKAFGARVVVYSAGGERSQREYSLRNITFKYPWVYNPDADEITPPDLRDEMLAVVGDASRTETAYRVRFKNFFLGRWIKHASLYPTWVVRLFRPDAVSFQRETNLTYEIQGGTGYLKAHFEHYSFNKGMSEWFAKHNVYSSGEAIELLKALSVPLRLRDCLSRDPAKRRKALKHLAYKIPGRPVLVFFYLYLARLGFLDGMAGFQYCILRMVYEHMIDIKVRELKRRDQGLSV